MKTEWFFTFSEILPSFEHCTHAHTHMIKLRKDCNNVKNQKNEIMQSEGKNVNLSSEHAV
jgi:hypothetical protein